MTSAGHRDSLPAEEVLASYSGGPTVLRMVLGAQLRKLRQASGISPEAAGYTIRASGSKINRLERGRGSCKERDIADLLTCYGVHGEQERAAMLRLAAESSAPGWWHRYCDVLPSWLESYVALEGAASRIRTYEIQFVPGLLQTDGYARTVITRGNPQATAEEIDQRVALRLARQAILSRPGAPQYWAVVHEEALRRPLGSRQLMRHQAEHILEVTQLPNVTLRIVPTQAEAVAGEGSPFTVLRFSEPELPDIVYLEHLTSAIYLDKRTDLDRYLAVMDRLLLEAGPLAATGGILRDIYREFLNHVPDIGHQDHRSCHVAAGQSARRRVHAVEDVLGGLAHGCSRVGRDWSPRTPLRTAGGRCGARPRRACRVAPGPVRSPSLPSWPPHRRKPCRRRVKNGSDSGLQMAMTSGRHRPPPASMCP